MKKTFLGLLAVTVLSFTACKKEEAKKEEATVGQEVANAAIDTATAAANATINNVSNAANDLLNNAPSFGVPAADEFVTQVKSYVSEVSANPANAAELAKTKGVELAKSYGLAMTKLNPEQRQQLTTWYQQVTSAVGGQ